MDVDIGQPREFRVARVHPPHVTSERRLPTARVIRVIEVVVSLWVSAERSVIDIRREGQRRAAAPAADQLRREKFPFCFSASIRPKESIKRTHPRLILAKANIGAVATEDVRLRHWQRHAGLTRISQEELASLNWSSVARQRFNPAAFNRRLVYAVFITQRIAVA